MKPEEKSCRSRATLCHEDSHISRLQRHRYVHWKIIVKHREKEREEYKEVRYRMMFFF